MRKPSTADLRSQVRRLPAPKSYFAGREQQRLALVENLILFARHSRTELQEQTFESRPHHRFVLVTPLQGEGMVSIDGAVVALPENSGILIFPYQFHQWIEVASERILWLFITFEHPAPDQLLPLRNVRFTLGKDLLWSMNDLVGGYNNSTSPALNNELLLRATLLLSQVRSSLGASHSTTGSETLAGDGKGRALLSRIEQQLHNYPLASIPRVPALASRLGMSESGLRAQFKQHVGISLGSYLRNYQVHRAIALMKDSTQSVSQIAAKAGFSSAASFSRAFKAHTGATPTQFRIRMPNPQH